MVISYYLKSSDRAQMFFRMGLSLGRKNKSLKRRGRACVMTNRNETDDIN